MTNELIKKLENTSKELLKPCELKALKNYNQVKEYFIINNYSFVLDYLLKAKWLDVRITPEANKDSYSILYRDSFKPTIKFSSFNDEPILILSDSLNTKCSFNLKLIDDVRIDVLNDERLKLQFKYEYKSKEYMFFVISVELKLIM